MSQDAFGDVGGVVPIGDAWERFEEDELAEIERQIGAHLPADYRDYLKRYGYSTFGDLVEFRPIEALPSRVSVSGNAPFSHFYGPASAGANALGTAIESYKGRMHSSVIPIASDGGGCEIVLGLSGPIRGRVFYWDCNDEWDESEYEDEHGSQMPEEAKFANMYLVSDTFTEFLTKLTRMD